MRASGTESMNSRRHLRLWILSFCVGCSVSLRASEDISCKSPDGTFALYTKNADTQPYYGDAAIIDARTHKVALQLESDRPPSAAMRLIWARDSQHVAYFNAEMR